MVWVCRCVEWGYGLGASEGRSTCARDQHNCSNFLPSILLSFPLPSLLSSFSPSLIPLSSHFSSFSLPSLLPLSSPSPPPLLPLSSPSPPPLLPLSSPSPPPLLPLSSPSPPPLLPLSSSPPPPLLLSLSSSPSPPLPLLLPLSPSPLPLLLVFPLLRFMQLISLVPTDPGVLQRMGEMYDSDNDRSQAFQYYCEVSNLLDSGCFYTVLCWLPFQLEWQQSS